MTCVAVVVAAALAALSGLHVYWSAGGAWGKAVTIPERSGLPALRPGAAGTLAVAALLAAAALLVLGRAGLGPVAPLVGLTHAGSWLVAAAFLLRGMGDFRLVGVFRRERGTRFARWDRRLYTPLSLALGVGAALVAAGPA